jgi:pyruvate dehydrogenase E2 component (dihydrolipoamide acetyltransferase)
MAEVIKMPKMSDTMTEGVIAAWHKKVGDQVKSGDVLAEVETDKATMDLESYEDGVLLHIGVDVKESVPVDAVIAIIGKKDENIDSLLDDLNGSSSSKEKSKSDSSSKSEKKNEDKEDSDSDDSDDSDDTSNINAEVITMPKMSDTMTEGTIVAWHKKEGDTVKSGDLLAEVATDKATMELESYEDGTLLYIGVKEGEAAEVDGIIAIIGEKGVDYKPLLKSNKKSASESKSESKKETKSESKSDSKSDSKSSESKKTSSSSDSSGRLKASPLAKKIAEDKGINIKDVSGSGEHGRIVKKDVENYKPEADVAKGSTPAAVQVGHESYEEIAVSQMRKTIARRLAESKFSAPHFYLTMEINMDKAIEARESINKISPVKVSFNDMVIKATAAALRINPKANSSWLGDKIRFNHHIHIGVAVAVEEGLLVPVVRFADSKSLAQIAGEVKDLGGKAKNKQLTPKDWEGNTFTISNLGMFGIEEFTAIVNPPDACILAVGGIKQTPIVKDGEMVIGNIMKVTLSCDHRVVDGAVGSAFLKSLKGFLEDPVTILV